MPFINKTPIVRKYSFNKKKSSRERWTGRQVSGPNMVQNRILCGILCSKFNILNARQRCVICNRIDSKMKGRLRDIEW